MSAGLIGRIAIGVILAVILIVQARGLVSQPYRRRAFYLGAVALVCFTIFNVALGMTGTTTLVTSAVGIAGVALFLGAVISLAMSFRNGERSQDRARIQAEAEAFRAERDQATTERPADE